jgi:hypothetical protein
LREVPLLKGPNTVLLQNFEVAPIINPLSEANQNLNSAQPCQSYQTEYGNMNVKATTKKLFEKNTKTRKKQTNFFNPVTDTDPNRLPKVNPAGLYFGRT